MPQEAPQRNKNDIIKLYHHYSLIMTIAMTARRMVIMIAHTNMIFQHMANTRLQYHDDIYHDGLLSNKVTAMVEHQDDNNKHDPKQGHHDTA